MEAAMYIVPGLAACPLPPSPKKSQETHDTCSCGSDPHHAKQPLSSCSGRILKPPFATMESDVADELVEKTKQRVDHALLRSSVLFQSPLSVDPVPKLDMDVDLTRGELLGSGGFASVYSVQVKDPTKLRFHKPGQDYVVKHLSPKLLTANATKRKLHAGTKDIVLESHILSALQHPNIVAIHGLSEGGIDKFAVTQRTDAYFMILPRLTCTLADKISGWKRLRLEQLKQDSEAEASKGRWWRRKRSPPCNKDKQVQQATELEFLCERLQILIDLCRALEYLHEKRIMHRDIKPPNVGFDKEGTLKLFDFGLAKELPQDSSAYSSSATSSTSSEFFSKLKTFQNLGNTGTTRYMAPEVIRREPYNCKVDVYATSIVCWELMTLKKPYGVDVSGQFVKECVAIYDDRPTIPTCTSLGRRCSKAHQTVWPKALKKLVQQGWTKDIHARLTAREMRVGFQAILSKKKQQHIQSKVLMGEDLGEELEGPPSVSLTNSMSC